MPITMIYTEMGKLIMEKIGFFFRVMEPVHPFYCL